MMENSTMFIVGFSIFAAYMWGYLTMIYRANKQQEEEMKNNSEE